MKDILLPTDFSKNASNALDYVLPIAKKANAELTLFNVTHMPSGNTTMHRDIREILKKDSEKALLELKNKIDPQYQGIKIHTLSRYGDLILQIKTLARAANIDLIVMGTLGASGMKEIFFGSNTGNVIEEVRVCPVLAVPYKATFKGIQKIVFTTNYSANNIVQLKELLQFSNLFNADIHILHIRTKKMGGLGPQGEHFKNRLQNDLPESKFTFHEVESDDIVEGLDKFVATEKIDLMAMVTRYKGFFGSYIERSLVKRVACHTSIPLLAFHENQIES